MTFLKYIQIVEDIFRCTYISFILARVKQKDGNVKLMLVWTPCPPDSMFHLITASAALSVYQDVLARASAGLSIPTIVSWYQKSWDEARRRRQRRAVAEAN